MERFFEHIRKFTILLKVERDAVPAYDRRSSRLPSTDQTGRNMAPPQQMWVTPVLYQWLFSRRLDLLTSL